MLSWLCGASNFVLSSHQALLPLLLLKSTLVCPRTMSGSSAIVEGLVREYLHRHGFSEALAALERELPRESTSFSSRSALAMAVGGAELLKKNKERGAYV
jgi:hypothetical protein